MMSGGRLHLEHLQGKWLTWYGQLMHIDVNTIYSPSYSAVDGKLVQLPFAMPGDSSGAFKQF